MTITRVGSFSDLIALLTETNTPHRADPEKQIVEVPASPGVLVCRWEKKRPYVQIIQVMVQDVPVERRPDVMLAICKANNTIPLPGFGFEFERNFIYMRLCVPMYEEGMLAQSFRKQMASVVSNAQQFVSPFQKVVQGESGEKILELAVQGATGQNPPS